MTYYHTIKYLRWIQIKYRIWYYFFKPRLENIPEKNIPTAKQLEMLSSIPSYSSYLGNNHFSFLNIKTDFKTKIDWNHDEHGKLWTYNLNYFEFLGQPDMSLENGLNLIHDFISKQEQIKDGLEPYPISLRIIFWIKFIIKHDVKNDRINHFLYQQLQLLSKIPEYHLMGNHLLENGFALLFGACFFNDRRIYQQAEQILIQELEEQILLDGAHFELSPMYHQTILFRILDSINLLQNNSDKINNSNPLLQILIDKSEIMCGWIKEMTFNNGDIPLVNDSCTGIAPTSSTLLAYAKRLKVVPQKMKLKESGYRKFKNDHFEMIMDIGNIGPDYIPGHAHSDTFNFVLYHHHQPLFVDTGISTYEKNRRRNLERSTASHNTVMVIYQEQSNVWGGFRVAKRAKIIHVEESEHRITAKHDGYKPINVIHKRTFSFSETCIVIDDQITGNCQGEAFFHFHPNVQFWQEGNAIIWNTGKILFKQPSPNNNVNPLPKEKAQNFDKNISIYIEPYFLATGFNQTTKAQKINIIFNHHLRTEIYLQK